MLDFSRDSGIFDEIFMILGLMKSGENVDFTGFSRTHYRSDFVKIKLMCG